MLDLKVVFFSYFQPLQAVKFLNVRTIMKCNGGCFFPNEIIVYTIFDEG